MNQTLLACLLAVAALTQVQARGSNAAAGSSESHQAEKCASRPDGGALLAQDTSRLGRLRGAHIAVARFPAPARPHQAEVLEAELLNNNVPASSTEAAGFEPETAGLPAALAITLRRPEAPLGRRTYRTRLVRTGRWATRREAVEILTCTYAGPLVLAQLPATDAAPAQVLAGPGYDATTPLRPLVLTQEAVLHLCGERAPQVLAYARLYDLHFQQADEVARLLDYYNRIATVTQ